MLGFTFTKVISFPDLFPGFAFDTQQTVDHASNFNVAKSALPAPVFWLTMFTLHHAYRIEHCLPPCAKTTWVQPTFSLTQLAGFEVHVNKGLGSFVLHTELPCPCTAPDQQTVTRTSSRAFPR